MPVKHVGDQKHVCSGKVLTHETAESILVGHFDPEDHRHSWLVAAGSNPAYEQFALQYAPAPGFHVGGMRM